MRTTNAGQIHRFHDHIGMYLGTGETVYLTKKQARAIARQLNKAAKDIDMRRFGDSQYKTFTLPGSDQ